QVGFCGEYLLGHTREPPSCFLVELNSAKGFFRYTLVGRGLQPGLCGLVVFIKCCIVTTVKRFPRERCEQFPAEIKRLLNRAVGIALGDELLLKRAAEGHDLLVLGRKSLL